MTTPSVSDFPPDAVLYGAAVTLIDPLLPAAARDRLHRLFSELDSHQPTLTRRYLTGLICDQALTLPDSDPWRTVELLPDLGGARWPDGRRFGSRDDFNDYLVALDPTIDPPYFDSDFAAVVDGTSDTAAALTVAAFNDYPQMVDTVIDTTRQLQLADLWETLRWFLIRRRCYDVSVDTWLWDSALAWTTRVFDEVREDRTLQDQWYHERAADIARYKARDEQPYPPAPG